MTHIGHVIENALGWDRDIWSIPGREIKNFAERVREWAHAVSPDFGVSTEAVYYGGWPSANLPTIGWGGVVSTALLLEKQVVGKDPISDWFCLERYSRPNLMASRPGWQPQGVGSPPDFAATRHFLAIQLPAIRALLPLLDAGLVVLVPSEIVQHVNQREIENVAQSISDSVLFDPPRTARRFQPQELAVDDDVKGGFVLAGGAVAAQTEKHLRRAVNYFAAEYMLSQQARATYTAVFEWESHLLREGVGKILSPVVPTTQLMLSSRIPILSGLTPKLIRSIHEDDALAEFRSDLSNMYGNCPLGSRREVDAYVREREKELLEPRLAQLIRETDRGLFSRIGIGARKVSFSLTAGLVSAGLGVAAMGPAGAAAGLLPLLGTLGDAAFERRGGSTRIWSALVKHGRTLADEVPRAIEQPGHTDVDSLGNPWGIDSEPGMSVTVTPGTVLHWYSPR